MRVQIISRDNGLGMTHDASVLREAIGLAVEGAEVDYCDWRIPGARCRHHYDINIFVEMMSPAFFPQARRNVYVPNPEWTYPHFLRAAMGVDEIWAKTRDTERIFNKLKHPRVVYTGWTSLDRFVDMPRQRDMIHVAGGSLAKGTSQVIDAVGRMPQHHLTMVAGKPWTVPGNVTLLPRQAHAVLTGLMNAHRVHLCPSSYEGFGHYINEARSVGAVIITTNAPPMNELVGPEYGVGVPAASSSRQNLAQHHHVDANELMRCIDLVMRSSDAALDAIGTRARQAYLAGRASFHSTIRSLLA